MSRLTKYEAQNLLTLAGIARFTNFYTLSASQVDSLLSLADLVKYRKPRNANGSRGRYFYEYLRRTVSQP